MEKFSKFIIEDDKLILMKVTFHKNIVVNKNKVKGGGWFTFDLNTKTYTLFGESHDFGKAKVEDIQASIANEKVYSGKGLYRTLNEYNFNYRTETETLTLKIVDHGTQ